MQWTDAASLFVSRIRLFKIIKNSILTVMNSVQIVANFS